MAIKIKQFRFKFCFVFTIVILLYILVINLINLLISNVKTNQVRTVDDIAVRSHNGEKMVTLKDEVQEGENYINYFENYKDEGEDYNEEHYNHEKENLSPKFYEMVKHRFKNRSKLLQEACNTLGIAKVNRFAENVSSWMFRSISRKLLYSTKYHLFVCLIEKNGCSTWRIHMAKLAGKNVTYKNAYNKHTAAQFAKNIFTDEEIKKEFLSSQNLKVFTARNPYARLVSVYKDKFNNGIPSDYPGHRVWYRMLEKVMGKSYGEENNRSVSFQEFLQVMTTRNTISMDPHFQAQHKICFPCNYQYNFILNQETYDEDLSYIFHLLKVTESQATIKMNERWKFQKSYEEYYNDVPVQLMKKIHDILEPEMLLFGYDTPKTVLDMIRLDENR